MWTPRERARSALAVAAMMLAGCAATPPAPRAGRHPPDLVGRTVAIAAPDLAGREVRVVPGGARLAVVDFWATWCEPCREQLPALDRIAARYRDRGVEVYAVAFDDDRREVEAFLAATPVAFPVLWDGGGAALARPLGITRLPTTVLVDGGGVVRSVHLGFDAHAERALEAELRRLLEEDARVSSAPR